MRDFVPGYHHAKFDCNWITNKEEKEGGGGGGTMCLGAYMVPKDNKVNKIIIIIIIIGLTKLRSNLTQGIKIGCWFLFLAQKVVLGTISDNLTQNRYLTPLLGQMPLRNSVIMVNTQCPR